MNYIDEKERELREIMIDKHQKHNEVREQLDGFVNIPLDAKLIAEYERTSKEHNDAKDEWLKYIGFKKEPQ